MSATKTRGRGKRKSNKTTNEVDDGSTNPKTVKCESTDSPTKSKYFEDTPLSSTSQSVKDQSGSQSIPGKVHCKLYQLPFSFYNKPCETLAKKLLGKILVTEKDGERIAGMIVETEAYLGLIDKAAHSYNGKRTQKTEAMFMKPGTAYVYNIYGMYCCLNISAAEEGAAVLLRAIEPTENLTMMNKLRSKAKGNDALLKNDGRGLANGPSKLCQAFKINKEAFNKTDMCTSNEIWLEEGKTVDDTDIVISKRININYAEDWEDKPLRFYINDNKSVSRRDKEAEKKLAK